VSRAGKVKVSRQQAAVGTGSLTTHLTSTQNTPRTRVVDKVTHLVIRAKRLWRNEQPEHQEHQEPRGPQEQEEHKDEQQQQHGDGPTIAPYRHGSRIMFAG